MVNSFSIAKFPEIYFGAGALKIIEKKVDHIGKQIILVTGKKSFINAPGGNYLLKFLTVHNIKFDIINVSGEPTATLIDDICKQFRSKKFDAVVSIGGGSVIDSGKAISAMLYEDGSIKDFLEGSNSGKYHSGKKIKFIAIPTTAGTGSETTKNAVISEVGENGFKRSLRHDNFVPDIAIVDPELTLNCPPAVTAASGLDAFVQLLESYVSTQASAFTDALALDGLAKITQFLEKAYSNGHNIEARTHVAYASMLSGITLANAGLGTVHGFASSIGSYYNIPHGVICGTLIGAVNRMNVKKILENENASIILKYISLGQLISKIEGKPDEYYINIFIDYVDKLVKDMNMPKLSKYGLSQKHVEKIIAHTSNKNNPVKLNHEELRLILEQRI